MKEWVYLSLAKQLPVVAGITPLYLDQAIDYLSKEFFVSKEKEKKASDIEIILEIFEFLSHPANESLLNGQKFSFASCRHLALLFKRYGIYGKTHLKWEKEPKDWQEHLWRHLASQFSYPKRFFESLEEKSADIDLSVHLFGFNHLSQLHFSFLDKLSKKIPIFFYHLSPCAEFWSDALSDKEAKRFFSKKRFNEELQITWEEYLEDHHPLLSNLGKMGRELASLVEDSEWPCIENYEAPLSLEKTQLRVLQNDLLFLTQSQETSCEDLSIQIHVSSTKYREIQNLYNTLYYLIGEKNLEPKDVIVMAPDITSYVPYIKTYFGKEIPFRIADIPLSTQDEEILALFKLLSLQEKRWSFSSVISLFSDPLFMAKQGWGSDEITLIKNWGKKAEICWGVNLEHVSQLLKYPFSDEGATWEAGFKRLYNSFLFLEERASEMVNIVESKLLGELTFLIYSLYDDLAPLYDESFAFSLSEWMEYLKTLYESYFFFQEGNLIEKLDALSLPSKKHSFVTLWPLIKEQLEEERITIHRHQLQSVTFCSLLPMRAIPAKVVCLIGMDHGSFPRKETLAFLDLLQKEKSKDYYPTRYDFDRYLFLEALLSARDYFILSYVGKGADHSEVLESSVISELLRAVEVKNIVFHPDASFDQRYFDRTHPLLKNASQHDFETAEHMFSPKKRVSFLPKLSLEKSISVPEGDHIIDLDFLRRLSRYPISFFLEKNFGITFKDNEKKDEEPFLLSHYHLGKARKLLTQKSLPNVVETLKKKGGLPLGHFHDLTTFRLAKEEEQMRPYSLKKMTFSFHQKEEEYDEEGWRCPPLIFSYGEKRKIYFVGKIESIANDALFTFEKCHFAAAVRHFFDFIILNYASQNVKGLQPYKMVFGKDQKEKETFFSSPLPYLKSIVEYYFSALENPSPLLPEWIDPILKRDSEKLNALFEKEKPYDVGASWALREPIFLCENWARLADHLYKDMKDAWF